MIGRRVIAAIVDMFVIIVIVAVLDGFVFVHLNDFLRNPSSVLFFSNIFWFYHVVFEVTLKASLGKKLLGLSVVYHLDSGILGPLLRKWMLVLIGVWASVWYVLYIEGIIGFEVGVPDPITIVELLFLSLVVEYLAALLSKRKRSIGDRLARADVVLARQTSGSLTETVGGAQSSKSFPCKPVDELSGLRIWHIYRLHGKVLVPTVARTEAGFFLDMKPVGVAGVDDHQAVLSLITDAISRENLVIPTPDRDSFPKPVVLKPSGLRSWKAFEKAAKSYCVSPEPSAGYEIIIKNRAPDGRGLIDDAGSIERLPSSASPDEVASVVMRRILEDIAGEGPH